VAVILPLVLAVGLLLFIGWRRHRRVVKRQDTLSTTFDDRSAGFHRGPGRVLRARAPRTNLRGVR
jgi:hypothetical protein